MNKIIAGLSVVLVFSGIMDIVLWVTERFTVPSWVYGTFMVLTAVIILGYELLLDHYRKRRG